MPEDSTLYRGVLGTIGTLGILLNGLLLFALWRNKTHEFRNGTSYIIGNLALADSLTGLAVIFFITSYAGIKPFQLSMVWTTIQASLLSLMVLSIERTIAFAYPFKSATIVTVRRTMVVLVTIWLLSICCGVAVHFKKVPSQFALTVIFEVSVITFTISHIIIYAKMKQRKKRMRIFQRGISRDTRRAMHQSVNNHVTNVVLILIFVLVVTLLPYMIALQLIFWDLLHLEPRLDKSVVNEVKTFAYYFYPVELLNFVVNPIIYAWRLKRYRQAFLVALAPLNCWIFKTQKNRYVLERTGSVNCQNSFNYKNGEEVLLEKVSANNRNGTATRRE